MTACGQSSALLQIGEKVCLPGAQLPGCQYVLPFNNNNQCMVYIVQPGDTISSIATSLNLYSQDLQNLNADLLSSGILQPNKFLRLPPWSSSCGDPNASTVSCRVYIVQSGDYLAQIAAAFGVTETALLSVNPSLTASSILQNGEPVMIPPFPSSCGAGTPSLPPTNTVLKCRGYQVQQGDSIQSIALAFQTTVSAIESVNPSLASGTLLQPGAVVDIPPYDSSCTSPILVTPNSQTTPVSSTPVPATPVPSTPVPSTPVPVTPIVSPSPVSPSSPSSQVPIFNPLPSSPSPLPSPSPSPVGPSPAPVSPSPRPVPVTSTSPPPPKSAASAKTVFAAIASFAMAVAVLAF
jgi:LysM repeat protein